MSFKQTPLLENGLAGNGVRQEATEADPVTQNLMENEAVPHPRIGLTQRFQVLQDQINALRADRDPVSLSEELRNYKARRKEREQEERNRLYNLEVERKEKLKAEQKRQKEAEEQARLLEAHEDRARKNALDRHFLKPLDYKSGTPTADICILVVDNPGSFNRNMTPAEWRAASLMEKYARATADGYDIRGFELYTRAEYHDEGNFNIVVTAAERSVRVVVDPEHFWERLRQETECLQLVMPLVAAVVTKDYKDGMIPTLCNNVRLEIPRAVEVEEPVRQENFIVEQQKPQIETEEPKKWKHVRQCACGKDITHPATKYFHVRDNFGYIGEHEVRPRFNWQSHVNNMLNDVIPQAMIAGASKERIERDLELMIRHLRSLTVEDCGKADMDRMKVLPQKVGQAMDVITELGPAVKQTLTDLNTTNKNFSENVIPTMKTAFSTMSSAIGSSMSKVDDVHTKAIGIIDKFNNFAPTGTDTEWWIQFASKYLSLIADIYSGAYDLNTWDGWLRFLLRLFNSFSLAATVITAIITYVKDSIMWLVSYFANKSKSADKIPEAHGPGVAKPLHVILSSVVGTAILGTVPDEKKMKRFSESIRTFNYMVPAMDTINDMFTYIMDMLPDYVRNWIYILSPSEKVFAQLTVGGTTRQWMKDVDLVLANQDEIVFDFPTQEKIIALEEQGKVILSEFAMTINKKHPDSKLFTLLRDYQRKIEKAKETVTHARGMGGTRVTPFCLYLYGGPGVGKSTLARFMVDLVVPKTWNKDNKMYTRNTSARFWDGYRRPFAVVFDDFHQDQQADDVTQIIQICSNNTFFPEFASLTDPAIGMKGTAFCSDLVILLSNESHPRVDDVIRSEPAFYRRRQMLIKMVPKVEFCLNPGVADPTARVFRTELRDVVNWTHVDFYEMDPLDRNAVPVKITLEDMCKKFILSFRGHMAREKAVMAATNKDSIFTRFRTEFELAHEIQDAGLIEDCGQAHAGRPWDEEFEDASSMTEADWEQFEADQEMALVELRIKLDKDLTREKRLQGAIKFLGYCGTITIIVSLLYLAYNKSKKYIKKGKKALAKAAAEHVCDSDCSDYEENGHAESSPERMKFKRGANLKRRMVAEGAKKMTDARKFVDGLRRAFPEKDITPAIDKVCECERATELYNAAISAGEMPDQAWLDRMERSYSEMYDQLNALLPQWPRYPDVKAKIGRIETAGHAEGSLDGQAMDLERDVFIPAMCSLVDETGAGVAGVMVAGPVGLFPRHFFSSYSKASMAAGRKMYWKPADGGQPKELRFDPKRMSILKTRNAEDKDLVLYNFGVEIRSYKNIIHHFMSGKDIAKYTHFPANMITYLPGAIPTVRYLDRVKARTITGHYTDGPDEYYITEGFNYESPSTPGFCGALLVVHNPGLVRKLVGIHVAALPSETKGYAELATAEQIEEAMRPFGNVVTKQPIPAGLASLLFARPAAMAHSGQDTTVTNLGTLPDEFVNRGSEKTSIVPSPLHDLVFQHTKEPAPLIPSDPRIDQEFRDQSMIAKGVLKFCKGNGSLRPDYAQAAIKGVGKWVRATLAKEPRFTLTVDEAINGLPQFTHCAGMEMATSPGYPLVLLREQGQKGKEYLFRGEPGKREIAEPLLEEMVQERRRLSSRLERPVSMWMAQLKDELRPISKIKIGKTRTFIAPPVDLTIVARQEMLAFTSALFRHCNDDEFFYSPGMNPFSYDWTHMIKSLQQLSPRGFDGDYSNFDSTLDAVFIDGVCDIINDWYDDDPDFKDTQESKNIRRTLFHEFIHSCIVVGNVVCYKHRGNPSGNPLTTPINSLVNAMYLMYAWMDLAPEEMKDTLFFRKNVLMKVFGDDMLTAVRDEVSTWYNMRTVADSLSKVGMELTSSAKDGRELVGISDLDSLTYLKAGFRKVGKLYFPLLDKSSIEELTNWITKTDDPRTLCNENCTDALKFAFFYGAEFYQDVKNRIERAARQLGWDILLPEMEFYENMFAKKHKMLNFAFHGCGQVLLFDEYSWNNGQEVVEPIYEEIGVAHSGRGNPEPHVLDESSPQEGVTTTSAMGISIIDQVEPIETQRVGETKVQTHMKAGMVDFDWEVANIVKRPTLVGTYTWSTTNPVGTNLQVFNVPNDLIVDNSEIHYPFQVYTYWRGTVRVRISVTGTKFTTGRLIAYFAPQCGTAYTVQRFEKRSVGQTSLQHVLIDPADNTAGVLDLSFVFHKNMLPLRQENAYDFLGSLVIAPFNSLRVGAGIATSVTYSVVVSFEDSTFTMSAPPELAAIRLTPAKAKKRKEDLERLLEIVNKYQRSTVENCGVAHGGVFSSYTNTYNLANSEMRTQGDQSQRSDLDQKGDFKIPTLDYPNINRAPPVVMRSPLGNFSNSVNIEQMERLALQPGDSMVLATPETFGTTQDEMAFNYLKKIQNKYSTFQWSTTDTPGSMKWVEYMCPMQYAINNGWLRGRSADMSTLDWISCKFSFWQGDLRRRIQIVASQYHTGKLFVSLMYGFNDWGAHGPTLAQVTAGRGFYISLNDQQHDFEVEMEYNAPTDMLRVPNGSIVPGANKLEYSMGLFSIWIVEALQPGPSVTTTIDINLWDYAGDNFQLNHLGSNNATWIPFEGPEPTRDIPSKRSGNETVENCGVAHSGTTAATSVAPGKTKTYNPLGERIRHIGDCIKRKVLVASVYNHIHGYSLDIGHMLFAQPTNPGPSGAPHWTPAFLTGRSGMMRWFGTGYRAYRGSMRFVVQSIPKSNQYNGSLPSWATPPEEPFGLFWDLSTNTISDITTSVTPSMGQLFNTVGPLWNNGDDYSRYSPYALASVPATWSDPGANYIKAEIPFVSLYKYKLISAVPGIEPESLMTSMGTLNIITPGVELMNTGDTPPDTGVLTGKYYIWASAGDEFRFGIYLGPPQLYLLNENIGSDHYAHA